MQAKCNDNERSSGDVVFVKTMKKAFLAAAVQVLLIILLKTVSHAVGK